MTQQEQERQAITEACGEYVHRNSDDGNYAALERSFKTGAEFALSELRKPIEYENSGKPIVVEVFADNGEHSHWSLIDSKTGDTIWEESEPIGRTDEELVEQIVCIMNQDAKKILEFGETKLVLYSDMFYATSSVIAKLIPSSISQENNVNVKLLEALKKLYKSASSQILRQIAIWITRYVKLWMLLPTQKNKLSHEADRRRISKRICR